MSICVCVCLDTFSFSVALSFGSCSPRFFHTPCSLALSVSLFFSKNFLSPGSGSRSLPFRPPRPLGGARGRGEGARPRGPQGDAARGVERWRRARGRHRLGRRPLSPRGRPRLGPEPGGRGGVSQARPVPGRARAEGPPPRVPVGGGASLRQLPPSLPPRPLPRLLLIPPPPPPPPSTPLAAAASSSPRLPPPAAELWVGAAAGPRPRQ